MARQAKAKAAKPAQPLTDKGLGPWAQDPATYIAGCSWMDEADKVAMASERKWGAGRLRLLVGQDLRQRFDRQRYLWNQALFHGDLEAVRREAPRMANAWKALDAAATAAGAQALPVAVWEIALPDGRVLALGRSNDDVAAYAARLGEGARAVELWSFEEVARLIAGRVFESAIKQAFPGATVEAVRTSLDDSLRAIPDSADPLDAAPF